MIDPAQDAHYRSIPEQYGRLVSTSLPAPGVTLSRFLQRAHGSERFYWESSRDHVAFAGSGTAIEMTAYADRFAVIERRARELFRDAIVLEEREPLASPRLFGGFSFREDFIPDVAWADFTPAHFVLPHYQLMRCHDETWLTINVQVPYDEDPRALLPDLQTALRARIEDLQRPVTPSPAPPQPTGTRYPMSLAQWTQMLNAAIDRMRAGELNKVVLSRAAEIQFDAPVDVDAALDYLAVAYPETYRFLFEPRRFHAFYGATPELLAGVQGDQMRTMALAGSIQRGNTPKEDTQFADDLMHSAKDRYEHQLVVDRIQQRLTTIADVVSVGETGIMALSNIQHLHTPITATLRDPSGVLPVVAALHPTPALGGDPRDVAMALIRDAEPVPRGWFAAPVGWIDRHLDGQFTVAIRSAVAQDKRAWLYAGAGIVKDSDPRKEWDETALKFRPMLNALGLTDEIHHRGTEDTKR